MPPVLPGDLPSFGLVAQAVQGLGQKPALTSSSLQKIREINKRMSLLLSSVNGKET